MLKIAPSILSADFARLGEQVKELERAGLTYLHVDVMDGHFVPNISIGLPVVKSLRRVTDMVLDVHLMIDNPEKYARAFASAGADIINFHIEASKDPKGLIGEIAALGKLPAITVKPGTDIKQVFPFLDSLHMVLIMSVEPGFGGQAFMPQTLEKAVRLKSEINRRALDVDIEMDGGIGLDNLCDVCASGVNVIVAGSAIFESGDIASAAESFLSRARAL